MPLQVSSSVLFALSGLWTVVAFPSSPPPAETRPPERRLTPPVVIGAPASKPVSPTGTAAKGAGSGSTARKTAESAAAEGASQAKPPSMLGGTRPSAASAAGASAATRGGGRANSVSAVESTATAESTGIDFRLGGGAASVEDVLSGWGSAGSSADLDGDGVVDATDLAHALAAQLAAGGSTGGSSAPLLEAGIGFSGATPEPAPVGTEGEPGYTARAIARWNAVPHRTFDAPFAVGVVAFHGFGIDRVDFSLNGGPWASVAEPTFNPESQTIEYWVRVDPTALSSGQSEIRAVVHPTVGASRVLAGAVDGAGADRGECSHYFVADPSGMLPRTERFVSPAGSDATGNGSVDAPFQTIMKAAKSIATAQGGKADGGIVNLLPGEHVYGGYTYSLLTAVDQRWLTIRPAPGVAPAAAPIVGVSTSGIRVAKVRFEGVVFRPSGASNGIVVSAGIPAALWLDGCVLEGAGKHISGDWCLGWARAYATDCTLTGSMNGLGGELVRNLVIDEVGSDAFTGAKLCVNSTVRSIHPGDSGFHPDFHQIYVAPGTTAENYILYGCRALEPVYAQGVFAGNGVSIRDVAIVDCAVSTLAEGNVMRALQYGGPTHHLLIERSEILGPALWRPDMNFMASEIVLRDNIWSGAGPEPSPLAGVLELDD
jgi:hypothetical protein